MGPLLSPDMADLLEIFETRGVDYAIVGGFAVNFYGYVRNTQDLDLLVFPSPENAKRVMAALGDFGFGAAGIPEEYFARDRAAIHLGVEPNRIDLLTTLEGVSNRQILQGRERVTFGEREVYMISLPDLLAAKRQSSRLKDRADVEELERSGSAGT